MNKTNNPIKPYRPMTIEVELPWVLLPKHNLIVRPTARMPIQQWGQYAIFGVIWGTN